MLIALQGFFVDLSFCSAKFLLFFDRHLSPVNLDILAFDLSKLALESCVGVIKCVCNLSLLHNYILVKETKCTTLLSVDLSFIRIYVLLELIDLLLKLVNILAHSLDLLLEVLLLTGFQHLLKLGLRALSIFGNLGLSSLEFLAHVFEQLVLLCRIPGSLYPVHELLARVSELLLSFLVNLFHSCLEFFVPFGLEYLRCYTALLNLLLVDNELVNSVLDLSDHELLVLDRHICVKGNLLVRTGAGIQSRLQLHIAILLLLLDRSSEQVHSVLIALHDLFTLLIRQILIHASQEVCLFLSESGLVSEHVISKTRISLHKVLLLVFLPLSVLVLALGLA